MRSKSRMIGLGRGIEREKDRLIRVGIGGGERGGRRRRGLIEKYNNKNKKAKIIRIDR